MLLLFLLVAPAFSVIIDESKIKEFKWRGPPVIDETIFTNPNSFDYDFTDDLKKEADLDDLYDQNVGALPRFNVYKLGKDEGYTKVPIVTRRWQTWSTPANTRGPLDFFATPSTPVSPVFVTTDAPITTKRMTTTTAARPTTTTPTTTTSTTTASTTTERTTVSTTTRRPRTTTTRRTTTPSTTTSTTTAAPITTTTEKFFFHREKIAHQPPPVFKSGRGPIWRKGGRIEFEETVTTTLAPHTLATTPAPLITSTTASFFRRRPFGIIPGIRREQSLGKAIISLVRTMGSRPRNSFRSFTTTTQPTTTTTFSTTTTPRPTRTTHAPVAFRHLTTTRSFTRNLPAPKPIIIHHGATKYRGPTYNCRVLNPFEDGKASPEHDHSCQMIYPGMSADGNCRCFYKVSERDEHGCAMGFLYACRPLNRTSVVV